MTYGRCITLSRVEYLRNTSVFFVETPWVETPRGWVSRVVKWGGNVT